MNNKGQELSIVGALMGLVGGILSYVMAKSMGTGTIGSAFIGIITVVVCYFLASAIMNK